MSQNNKNDIAPAKAQRGRGVKVQSQYPQVIRYHGDPNTATTLKGFTVHRGDGKFLWDQGDGNFMQVEAVPYDTHFVYKNPHVEELNAKEPVWMCTCGFIAGIAFNNTPGSDVVPDEYKGKLCCQYDALTGFKGKHQTSQVNIREIEKYAGRKQNLKT